MKRYIYAGSIILLAMLSGCDCIHAAGSGILSDSGGTPIADVTVTLYIDGDYVGETKSSSDGHFALAFVGTCDNRYNKGPDVSELAFEKIGYKKIIKNVDEKSSDMSIVMELM